MATVNEIPKACRSHWSDLPAPPAQDEGYHLHEIRSSEWMNVGPTPGMSEVSRKMDAELIRKGYMTVDECGRYRTTEEGRHRASEFQKAEADWQKEFHRCLLADEAAGRFD